MNSITFGELIKERRLEQKLALREVAGAINFDQSLLSKVERNKIVAPQKIIMPLSKCLKLDFKELQIKYLSERIYREYKEVEFTLEAMQIAIKQLEKEHSGNSAEFRRKSMITKITRYLEKQPVEKVWLFGSFARNEENDDSDIDILVRFTNSSKMDLFEYIGIRQDLEDLTGRPIDLVEEGYELEKAKPSIFEEKQLIYERKTI